MRQVRVEIVPQKEWPLPGLPLLSRWLGPAPHPNLGVGETLSSSVSQMFQRATVAPATLGQKGNPIGSRAAMVRAIMPVAMSSVVSQWGNLQSWLVHLNLPSLRCPLLAIMAVLTLSPSLHCTAMYGVSVPRSTTRTLLIGAEHPEIGNSNLVIGTSTLEIDDETPGIGARLW